MVVTVTNTGWIKRVPLSTYRAQRRGGKGRAGMATKEEDFVRALYVVNTHTPVLFFSTTAWATSLKVYKLPGHAAERGKAMVTCAPQGRRNHFRPSCDPMPRGRELLGAAQRDVATSSGTVRRNDLSTSSISIAPARSHEARRHDRLIGVATCDDKNDVLLATRRQVHPFEVSDVRVSRTLVVGVRGIKLADGDEVIPCRSSSMWNSTRRARRLPEDVQKLRGGRRGGRNPESEEAVRRQRCSRRGVQALRDGGEFILTVTRNGFGKRTSAYEYRITNAAVRAIVSIATASATRKCRVVPCRRQRPGDDNHRRGGLSVSRWATCGSRAARPQGVTMFSPAKGARYIGRALAAGGNGEQGYNEEAQAGK